VSSACRAAVGDWDERYFLYSEETDFLRRVRATGLRVRYEPTAVVCHVIGGSGTSDQLYALCAVNSVRYYRRYHARFPSAVFTGEVALCQLVRSRRPAARLALRALLSPTVRSTLPRPTQVPVSRSQPG
jgi:N-acetylglucosaminyl-diphospho-decaprenol L-rhamnosyltransferase